MGDLKQSANQAQSAEAASAKAGMSTPETRQASQEKSSTQMAKAQSRVEGMESKAAKLESSIASAPAANQQTAIAAAQAQYTATAHGYEILGGEGNQQKADAMHQKAAEVGRTPSPAPSASVEDPNMK